MKPCQSRSQIGFQTSNLHAMREPHATYFLKQRASFLIAALSLFTFVVGNMVGQHGWYTFMASVLGNEDLTQIVYVGTVTPLENVVDYDCWGRFGGNPKEHTFRQAPRECLRAMPSYRSGTNLLSMEYMSSYAEGREGTGDHSGIDFRVPQQTPVRSVMNGIIHSVGSQPRGFGTYIVVKHPNVPDPDNPRNVTTLYSTYGHLSSVYATEGDIVSKGELIALSGNTGFSTGPHLDFRLVRDTAPFLPYDPYTEEDGYKYTVSPLAYVESHVRDTGTPHTTLIASSSEEEVVMREEPVSIVARLQARRAERLAQRLAERTSRQAVALTTGVVTPEPEPEPEPVILSESTEETVRTGAVTSVDVSHDGSFSGRGWEKVRIRLIDDNGDTVSNPRIDHDILLRTEFGTAEFRPQVLSPLDFNQGEATVYMLPRGRRTVVIKVLPFNVIAAPMEYER